MERRVSFYRMEIRSIKIKDTEDVAALLRQLRYTVEDEVVAGNIAVLSAHPDHIMRACEFDGKVIGCISAHIVPMLGRPAGLCMINYLAVDEHYKNYAVAIKLEESVIRFAKLRNCETVQFRCNTRRMETRRFYERLGYRGCDKWMEKSCKASE